MHLGYVFTLLISIQTCLATPHQVMVTRARTDALEKRGPPGGCGRGGPPCLKPPNSIAPPTTRRGRPPGPNHGLNARDPRAPAQCRDGKPCEDPKNKKPPGQPCDPKARDCKSGGPTPPSTRRGLPHHAIVTRAETQEAKNAPGQGSKPGVKKCPTGQSKDSNCFNPPNPIKPQQPCSPETRSCK